MRLLPVFTKACFCVFLLAVITSGIGAESQAKSDGKTGADSQITGEWASPDCGRPQTALLVTSGFMLLAGKNGFELTAYRRMDKGPDHLILATADEKLAAQRSEDGMLRLKTAGDTSIVFEEIDNTDQHEYAHCAKTPPQIPATLRRMMRHIDRLRDDCSLTKAADQCARTIFKMADSDNSGFLTAAEIKLAALGAGMLARLADQENVSLADLETAVASARKLGEALADHMQQAQDKDANGKIDYNEAVENFSASNIDGLDDMIFSLRKLL